MVERVHIHSIRDFPRAKLDRDINACFLLNEHGDLIFFFIISKRIVSSIPEEKLTNSRILWLLVGK